jgi:hypothetical protein
MDRPYTQKRHAQFRGPTTSDDYNSRQEELLADLVFLYNKAGLSEQDIHRVFARLSKEQIALLQRVEELETRILAVESDVGQFGFFSTDQIDTDRFDTTAYEVSSTDRCSIDTTKGLVMLPEVVSSSVSQLRLINSDGTAVIPPSFEYTTVGDENSADDIAATIDTSRVYDAILGRTGRVWERNVIVDAPDIVDGARVTLFVSVPQDITAVAESNALVVHPYPALNVDLEEVSVTSTSNVVLNTQESYTSLNPDQFYDGNDEAVGWLPPGAWDGDAIVNSGPKTFHFDPRVVTGIKIVLHTDNLYLDANTSKFIYTYGLSHLDLRYNTYLDSGKTIIRFDAPSGTTISSVDNVTPQIWNVSEAELPDIFDYRVIWETAYNSGVYTLDPVSFSQRVWIEVTLNKTAGRGTPSLSGLLIDFS